MEIVQDVWLLSRFVSEQDRINLNPTWQRGAAWKSPRQALLIDSILRGMDIPKIYLRRNPPGSVHDYDAVDGQQRLRAMWMFEADELALDLIDEPPPIDGHPVAGLRYSDLHPDLKARFDNFQISVADIITANGDEISTLFSRLQMGVSLNPAELRNALGGPLRHVIDAIATSHPFFLEGRIPDVRYKRQDYVTHAFAMAAYEAERDIKAPDLKRMFLSYATPDQAASVLELAARVGDALNVLEEVNRLTNLRITQKWIFVDLCWLIMQRQKAGAGVNAILLAACYDAFEDQRRRYQAAPEVLVRAGRTTSALDRHLYAYIQAFKLQAGTSANLQIRAQALRAFCPNIDGEA